MAKKATKSKGSVIRKRKKQPLLQIVNQLQDQLYEKEKIFNEDPDRFVELVIKNQVTSVDLSVSWLVVERQLKKGNFTPEKISQYKEKNAYYTGLFLDIEKLKIAINKEKDGQVYRRQPVLREQGKWIIRQSGEFRSIKSIHNELTKGKGYNISISTLRSFIYEHKGDIDKIRDDFRSELLSSSISVDSGRLKFWQEAYEYYYNKWLQEKKMVDFNACAKILSEVRVEVKGDLVVKIDGKIDINHSIEASKSLNQKVGELDINLIVIALAAQKSNINPLYLLTQLADSYYNRWNGVTRKPLTLQDKDQLSPVSNMIKNYNWDDIRKKNEAPVDFGSIEDAIIIDEEEEKKIINAKKQRLLDLLTDPEKRQ